MNIRKKIKVLTILTILFITCLILNKFLFSESYNEVYLSSIKTKKTKLDKVEGRKIIVIGGVNALFGVNSIIIEEQLGIPVINMAINSDIGYNKAINFIKNDLEANDVVIFFPDYNIASEKYWLESSTKEYQEKYLPSNSFHKDNIKEGVVLKQDTHINRVELNTVFPKVIIDGLKEQNNFFKTHNINFYIYPSPYPKDAYSNQEALNFWKLLSKKTGVELLTETIADDLDDVFLINNDEISIIKGKSNISEALVKGVKSKKIISTEEIIIEDNQPDIFNKININSINEFYKVNEVKNNKLVTLRPQTKNAYVRIKHKEKKYENFTFSITLKCKKEDVKNIKFFSYKIEEFDFIEELEKEKFVFYKENLDEIYFEKEKSSYMGVLFDDISTSGKVEISNVSLTEISPRELKEKEHVSELSIDKNQELIIKVVNPHKGIRSTKIFNQSEEDYFALRINYFYRLERSVNNLYVKDFYTGEKLFKQKVKKGFKLISPKGSLIKVFK